MNTNTPNKKRFLSRLMAMLLVASLTLGPVEMVSAATKTKTTSIAVLETTGILSFLNYYGKDKFQVTYDTTAGTITKVKTSAAIRVPKGFDIIERDKITRKKLSTKKWRFKTTWYLNFKSLPAPLQAIVEKTVPLVGMVCTIGRFVVFKNTYYVYGTGKVKRVKNTYNFMVPSNLLGTAQAIYEYFTK